MLLSNKSNNQLASVVQAFEEWRASRTKIEPIPEKLWWQVKSIATQYSKAEIASALRLNHSQLKRKLSALEAEVDNKVHASTLVECLPAFVLSPPEPKTVTLTFSCKHGNPVSIAGLRDADLPSIISTLIGSA